MRIRAVSNQCAEWCEYQRQREHDADQRRRHVEFDDHHAIERADEQHQRHAHRHLEQR